MRKAIKLLRSYARATISKIQQLILYVSAGSGLRSSLYYIVNSEFYREHRAVILGQLQYNENIQRPSGSVPLLRRNIHRLEKGMIMVPRRIPFGVDYIGETLDAYEKTVSSQNLRITNEVLWARDVLMSYFSICGNSAEVKLFKAKFDALSHPQGDTPDAFSKIVKDRVPYTKKSLNSSGITHEKFHDLCIQRRSTRWFEEREVDISLIDKAISSASLAPSACNRQPYKFLVFNKQEDATAVAELAGGTGGFAHQIPALIALIGDLSNYFHERDRHLIYIDASLAAMTFMHAAETLGLSTCPINWSDVAKREKSFYQLVPSVPRHMRPIMLIAVGYADQESFIPYSSRKEIDLLRVLNPALAKT
ncbi:nitroreductase family protein [Tunicatimonas pelagia]|uniref:nitroreductase family protein n=1 Tax=Tunicatimonas pelagia TaxID=931531 RepID=UPI0026671CFE|nr:nitroreductase family protein [Tunicatimonas pelagia]WKN40435.1 nitroreductase family protein [Tunicatimonas pelagia]